MVPKAFAVAFLLLFGSILTVQADTVTVNGTTAGTFVFDGITYELSPYGGTLDGQSVQFICVDQSAHIQAVSGWDATVTSLPNGPFGNTVQSNQLAYLELAYLATQMLNDLSAGLVGRATAYQFAIWSFTGGPDPFVASSPSFDNASLVGQAAAAVAAGYNGAGWEIVSPLKNPDGTFASGQEMLVQTPEPSSLMLLCAGMITLAAFFPSKRQHAA